MHTMVLLVHHPKGSGVGWVYYSIEFFIKESSNWYVFRLRFEKLFFETYNTNHVNVAQQHDGSPSSYE